MPHSLTPAALDELTRVNQDDFFESLGLKHLRWGRALLNPLVWPAARGFAHAIDRFDAEVGLQGLASGSAWLIEKMTGGLRVAGRQHIPASGPTLVLSNHPGLADTVALFAALPREDVRIIAKVRPFLRALPNVSRYLIYVPDDESERMSVVRQTVSHLKHGGLALTFPAGEIEPDPAFYGAEPACASLERWSNSIAVFARLAPQTKIVPAIVSHVLSPAAQNHPLTRMRRTLQGREQLGAMLQIIFPLYQNVAARVAFGPPLLAQDLLATHADAASLTQAVTTAARQLIEHPPAEWDDSLLD